MWVFMVTNPGHDNCLPGKAFTGGKKEAHLPCLFLILRSSVYFLHLQKFDSCSKSKQGLLWSTLAVLTFPASPLGAIFLHANEAGVDMQRRLALD